MKIKFSSNCFTDLHKGENRHDRRFANKVRKNHKNKKSYFAVPNEVIEKYRTREISAYDVTVYAALCSLRHQYDVVRATQELLAFKCGFTPKTVSKCVERLYDCGLIVNVLTETSNSYNSRKPKYMKDVYIYQLKPLNSEKSSGFFLVQRKMFWFTLTAKAFVMYMFLCKSLSFEYEKTWNSYNDICDKLGFGRGQRSEVVALINVLAKFELIRKTVRKIKGVFVDNIYRVTGFEILTEKTTTTDRNEIRPSRKGTHFTNCIFRRNQTKVSSINSIPRFQNNVKPKFEQLSILFL